MDRCEERRLFVAWRQTTGHIVPVGLLSQRHHPEGHSYRFAYLKQAEDALGRSRLPGFPDLYEVYDSESLFPTFANRLMPRSRPDYDAFVTNLGLCTTTDPFEVMERSGGRRETDRIEVFASPNRAGEDLVSLFFARGIRHVSGAEDAVSNLEVGMPLSLQRDPGNEFNAGALHLVDQLGRRLGYLPDYLVSTFHELQELNHSWPEVTVEHLNSKSVAPHMRLLCRALAAWPARYEPFSGPEFEPLVDTTK